MEANLTLETTSLINGDFSSLIEQLALGHQSTSCLDHIKQKKNMQNK